MQNRKKQQRDIPQTLSRPSTMLWTFVRVIEQPDRYEHKKPRNHHTINSLKRPSKEKLYRPLPDNRMLHFTPEMSQRITVILFALVIVAVKVTNCDTICPKDLTPIYPCSCQNGTQGLLLKCTNTNLAILSNSLRNIQEPVEQIEIENSTVTKVFGNLFKQSDKYLFHTTLRELDIRASQVKSIDHDSFSDELLFNTQYLMLDRNYIQQVPSELVNKMRNLKLLNLSTNAIAAVEANAFAKLFNLTELDLSSNKITRLAKGAFNSLTTLEYLNLDGNELSKLEKNLFSFGRKLKHLDLSNNKLSSLDRQDFGELTVLETLRIASNQLSTIPRSIFSRNAKLYNLDLSFNKLDDIDTYLFKSTRFLKDLNMSGNLIKEITKNTFSPTTRIKRINMSQNLLQALAPETFKGLEWLERIDLSHNQIVNISNDAFSRIYSVDIDLSYNKLTRIFYWAFHEVSNITKLDLSHNLINEGISQIAFDNTDCAYLDLSYNQIQDISKIPVSNLTGIRILDISHNQITEFNKKSFAQKIPLYELHTIDASYNNISGISGNVLERLKSIRLLNVSHNSLRRLTSGAFGNSPTLLELDLSHNNLVEIVSGTLVGLVSMKNLNLSHNRLKKMIPIPVALNSIHLEYNEIGQLSRTAFPSLNSLLELHLDHNRISHLDEGTFATLLALHTLSLSHNNISSVPASALKDLASLQSLRLNGNNIQRLPRRAFGTLPIVFKLWLDHNNISSISDYAFDGMLQLLMLNLSHNNIIEIPPEAFAGLVSLRELDLSNNQLDRFENKTRSAMEDLLSLEVANFSNNKLSTITPKTFLSSPYIPYRLVRLDLSNNLIGVLVNHFANGLKKVEWLSLRNNIINEIFPQVVGQIPRLKYLDLSHNKLRTLREGTFSAGQLVNLSTILLNNNKLSSVEPSEFENLKALEMLDLSSNRLERFFNEFNRWTKRGTILDLRHNNLECTCKQLPLVAWADNIKAKNETHSEQQVKDKSADSNTYTVRDGSSRKKRSSMMSLQAQAESSLFDRHLKSSQLISETTCARPEIVGGKSMMQMLELTLPTSEMNCDRETLDEVDTLKRLRAPIQYYGAEPYNSDGEQHLQIGWTLVDPQIDLLNFVVLRAKFQAPFDLSTFHRNHPSTVISSARQLQRPHNSVQPETPVVTGNLLNLVEYNIERVAYSERRLVLKDLDPRAFYVVCIFSETSDPSSTQMIDHLQTLQQNYTSISNSNSGGISSSNNLSSNAIKVSGLLSAIFADYSRVNCAELGSLLQQDISERLISASPLPSCLAINTCLLVLCQLLLQILQLAKFRSAIAH